MRIWHVLTGIVLIALIVWAFGGFTAEKAPKPPAPASDALADRSDVAEDLQPAASVAEAATVEEPVKPVMSGLDGLNPITRDSGYEVFETVSRSDTFEPQWPEGTDQTSVGYSNPEEYPDGRTFWTRSQTNEGEIMVFVAQCISVNDGERLCQSEDAGAVVGLVIGHQEGEYPVKLWDAELKTLTFHGGGIDEWRAFVYELANFISANKGGAPVEILGPTQ